MKKKHDPPPVRDRPPAMFVGDEAPPEPPPVSAHALDAGAPQAAALVSEGRSVVIEGTRPSRIMAAAAGVLVALALGIAGMQWTYPDPYTDLWLSNYASLVGGIGALAWLAHRDLLRPRRKFYLLDSGIEVEVWPLAGGTPRNTYVPYREIVDYAVSVDGGKASLRVESILGFTLTLCDRPPRPSTHEFIRRFVEQAERHPRAVRFKPHLEDSNLPDITGERAPALGASATFLAILLLASSVESVRDPSFAQEVTGIAALGLIGFGVHLWWTLDDYDAAVADRDSRHPVARLRRWLRRVLGIRVS